MDSKLKKDLKRTDLNKPFSGLTVHQQESKIYKSAIIWSIKRNDLNVGGPGNYKESNCFSIGSPRFCKLSVRIFPAGKTEDQKSFVALSLCFSRKFPSDSWYKCTVSFVNDCAEILKSEAQSGNGNDLGMIEFDNFAQSRRFENYLVHDKLTIQCNLNVSCKSSSYVSEDYNLLFESQTAKIPRKSYDKMRFSDVVFEFENEEISGHKAILANKVPMLRILFKAAHPDEQKFKLKKINPSVFKQILHFVYVGEVSFKSFKNVCEIYIAASNFQICKLKDICCAYISVNLCETNVIVAQNIARNHHDADLMKKCIDYIKNCSCENLPCLLVPCVENNLSK